MNEDAVQAYVLNAAEENIFAYSENMLSQSNLIGGFTGSHVANDGAFCTQVYTTLIG